VLFARFNIYNFKNVGACKTAGTPLRKYITLYWSAVRSETGKRFTLSVHDSRHYALKIIQEPLNLLPEVRAGSFYARGMVD